MLVQVVFWKVFLGSLSVCQKVVRIGSSYSGFELFCFHVEHIYHSTLIWRIISWKNYRSTIIFFELIAFRASGIIWNDFLYFRDKLNWKGPTKFELSYFSSNFHAVFLQNDYLYEYTFFFFLKGVQIPKFSIFGRYI
jgi:hypothetical protein